MVKEIINKIINKKNLKEDELYDLGLMNNGDYNNLKSIIANLKRKNEEELQNLSAHLITKQKIPLVRDNPRTFKRKAGDPLDLILNIEGGSGEYTLDWRINSRSPEEAIGEKNYPKHIKNRITMISIPTNVLQTIEDINLLKAGQKGVDVVGTYEWEVVVYDVLTKKSSSDKLRIIITRNEKVEKELEKSILKLKEGGLIKRAGTKAVGFVRGDKEVNIKEVLFKENDKAYTSGRISKTYLLPLDKPIELIGAKGKLIDKVIWILHKGSIKDNKHGTWIEAKEKGVITLQSKFFQEGIYELEFLGCEKKFDPKKDPPTSKDSVTVYIRKTPEIIAESTRFKVKGEFYRELEIDKPFRIKTEKSRIKQPPYIVRFRFKDNNTKEDLIVIEQSEKDKRNPRLMSYDLWGNSKNSIELKINNKTGNFSLIVNLLVKNKEFGYEEIIPIIRKIEIFDQTIIKRKIGIIQSNKIFEEKIRPLLIEIVKEDKGERKFNGALKNLEGNLSLGGDKSPFEMVKGNISKEDLIKEYHKVITDHAEDVIIMENELARLLMELENNLRSLQFVPQDIYAKINAFLEGMSENEVVSNSIRNLCEDLIKRENSPKDWPDKDKRDADIKSIGEIMEYREKLIEEIDKFNMSLISELKKRLKEYNRIGGALNIFKFFKKT